MLLAPARRLRDNRRANGGNQYAVKGRAHEVDLSAAWRSAIPLVLKVLLAVLVLVLLGSVGGAVAYASPVTLPVLFLAARFSHRTAEGLLWAALAAATALETAWLLAFVALGGAALWIWLFRCWPQSQREPWSSARTRAAAAPASDPGVECTCIGDGQGVVCGCPATVPTARTTPVNVIGVDPIYDSRGDVCGWRRTESLFDVHGSLVGFVHDECLMNSVGRHVGWLQDGHFLDHRGGVVGWLRDFKGGPLKPHTTMRPLMPPITSAASGSLVGPRMSRTARLVMTWSALSWTELFDDGRASA